ncbi:ABC transporter substrate-binding protein [Mesorhizobium sp.]|uniref:ABC transporter substrate-binding protein n=1 Tax=Mesorhizobium sp. TaxID=1871066 RepID=UPI000FE86BCC|nr:ABC transporter substrate-binding protein [Mesorhizobium sp.]RWM45482.1 MAG: ABC transporter substrate-binding protein [Mesorhizobium sp.]RWM58198.1 MAG: ABC transporter substrate-binding protein [Mesorhizobium sp.]RWM58637.1 MAG: ABC transporter substrate-binding protein [Mesorhizobium sp.]TIO70064.1 MAG: ABC transporter substrate-binding protein [Mesorhizobium sp.]TJV93954.1 MAG: ABC transporter substrate-binding protein [Mesorhizobium sp.]
MSPNSIAGGENPLELIVFPGGFNWSLFVANEKGFFADNGVAVNITPTPDSKFQMAGLIDGRFDIAFTAMDNVVAYSEGQGVATTEHEPDIFAFMGCDSGFLRLVSVPDVTSIEQLAGSRLGVDALTTGYAFVLHKLLDLAGIGREGVNFVQAGGVKSRCDALLRREFEATLLITPFEAIAEEKGFNRLADASRALGAYQGVVAAARRPWARDHGHKILAFIRGYRAALDWLFDPANKKEALEIFRRNVPGVDDAMAGKSYEILLDKDEGFFRDGHLDKEGIANVVALRSEYGQPSKVLDDPAKYYDASFLADAGRRAQR